MLRATRLSTRSLRPSHIRAFSTRQRPRDAPPSLSPLLIGGVAVRDLATLPRRELERRVGGRSRLQQLTESLPHEVEQLLATRSLKPPALAELFDAAAACQSAPAMAAVLQALPRVDVARHNALFNALHRHQDRAGMRAFFEAAAQQLPRPLPDVVYRFGVVGALSPAVDESLEPLARLMQRMREDGVAPSAETWSHLMLGLARRGDRAQAMKAFAQLQQLQQSQRKMHEADMNRALLALGCLGETREAFAFYERCALPLSATIFNALLSVCLHNGATLEASAVLANRERFQLRLDRVGYARTLEALEQLDRRDEIGAVLAEMRALGVSFGTQIEELIARNQQHLQGTPFVLETTEDGDHEERVTALQERLERLDDAPSEAAQAADALVRPLRIGGGGGDSNEGARLSPHRQWLLRVGATSVAPETALPLVVQAYAATQQTHKLHALARGLELTTVTDDQEKQARADALTLLLQDAMARGDEELARIALRVVAKEKTTTLTLTMKSALVRSLVAFVAPRDDVRDAVATLHRLCLAVLNGEEEEEDREQVLTLVLGALVRQDASVAQLVALLEDVDRRASATAAVIGPRVYADLLSAMKQRRQRVLRDQRKSTTSQKKSKTYNAEDVAALWRDCRRRVGRVDAALLNASSAWLAQSDDERHWRLLVDAYDAAVVDSEAPPLHAEVFEHVLAALQRLTTQQELEATRVLAIVDAARGHLSRQQQGVPAALVATATELLAAQQALTPDAIERVLLPLRKPPTASLLLALHALTTKTTTAATKRDVEMATLLLQRLVNVQPRGIENFATADALIKWLSVSVDDSAREEAAALAWDVVVAYEQRKVATDSDDVMADAKRWTKLVKHADGARQHAAWYQRVVRLVEQRATQQQHQRLMQRVKGLEALALTLEQEKHEEQEQEPSVDELSA